MQTVSDSAKVGTAEALKLSVVLPCLNERETVGTCVQKAVAALESAGIHGESSSLTMDRATDRLSSPNPQERVSYTSSIADTAMRSAGIQAAHGTYVLMADSDDSYEFAHIPRFLEQLRKGADLVMGNRFLGGIRDGAMPPLHRYLGNPVLTAIGRSSSDLRAATSTAASARSAKIATTAWTSAPPAWNSRARWSSRRACCT